MWSMINIKITELVFYLRFVVYTFLVFFTFGCSPSISDYYDKIGTTNYYDVFNDKSNRFIVRKENGKITETIVDRNIIDLYHSNGIIFAVRQKTVSYYCEEGTIATIFFHEFEYWILDNTKNPIVFLEYDEFISYIENNYKKNNVKLKTPYEYKNIVNESIELVHCSKPVQVK